MGILMAKAMLPFKWLTARGSSGISK